MEEGGGARDECGAVDASDVGLIHTELEVLASTAEGI